MTGKYAPSSGKSSQSWSKSRCKPRPSRVSVESPELENIPKVPGKWAKVCQNHPARKAVSATLSVLKWSGAIFRYKSSKPSFKLFFIFPFDWKPRPSLVSLKFPGRENVHQVPGNPLNIFQNHPARKTVSTTFWVLTRSGAILRPKSSKPSVQLFFLCPFY